MAFFGQAEMGYLGFWVPHDGVKPADRKNTGNKKYGATNLPKISMTVYRQ